MFYYATTNSGDVGTAAWTYMFSVDAQALTTYTFDLGADGFTGGAFYVGVIDNTSANSQADTLEVDYMCVNTTLTTASTGLEHKWTITVPSAGSDSTFYAEAYRTNLDAENTDKVESLITDYLANNNAMAIWVSHNHAQLRRVSTDKRFDLSDGRLDRVTD